MNETETLNKPETYPVQDERPSNHRRKQILLWVGVSLLLLAFIVMLIFVVKMRADAGKNLPENISIARKHILVICSNV